MRLDDGGLTYQTACLQIFRQNARRQRNGGDVNKIFRNNSSITKITKLGLSHIIYECTHGAMVSYFAENSFWQDGSFDCVVHGISESTILRDPRVTPEIACSSSFNLKPPRQRTLIANYIKKWKEHFLAKSYVLNGGQPLLMSRLPPRLETIPAPVRGATV